GSLNTSSYPVPSLSTSADNAEAPMSLARCMVAAGLPSCFIQNSIGMRCVTTISVTPSTSQLKPDSSSNAGDNAATFVVVMAGVKSDEDTVSTSDTSARITAS